MSTDVPRRSHAGVSRKVQWHAASLAMEFDSSVAVFKRVRMLGFAVWSHIQISHIHIHIHIPSGVLLKMEVGIRKGAWRRAWRCPAYWWSRCQKNPEVGIRRIPAYTPQYTTGFSGEKILKSEIAVGEFWRISGERMITSNWIALRAKVYKIDTLYRIHYTLPPVTIRSLFLCLWILV